MTMPIGPSFIALQVRDLAASATFYREVFGFTPQNQNPPGAVVFTTKPIALAPFGTL
jgi:catechol 2,3-dioxygenase-like lactoylglutathione lyase family enzyme